MNAAEKLHEEYQRQLGHLQETCPHEKRSDWIEEWWAVGHSTERKVKVCQNCNKVLQAKMCCHVCQQEFPEEELQTGDGRTLPFGGKYCPACYRAELSAIQETQRDLSSDV